MAPRHPIPNMTVKRCSGDNTSWVANWEDSTMLYLFYGGGTGKYPYSE